jgi:Recombination endonuclease VII
MKKCYDCKEFKNVDCFWKNKTSSDGLSWYCKSCGKRRNRTYCKENKDSINKQVRESYRQKKYGISPKEWEVLFNSQNGRCAICETGKLGKNHWHTDHDHQTGRIRGILCSNCNTALGLLKDDITRLEKSIEYLRK